MIIPSLLMMTKEAPVKAERRVSRQASLEQTISSLSPDIVITAERVAADYIKQELCVKGFGVPFPWIYEELKGIMKNTRFNLIPKGQVLSILMSQGLVKSYQSNGAAASYYFIPQFQLHLL